MAVYHFKATTFRPDFPTLYKYWIKDERNAFKLSLTSINERYTKYQKVRFFLNSFKMGYSKFEQEKDCVDYNQSVAELLKMTAHSSVDTAVNDRKYSAALVCNKF